MKPSSFFDFREMARGCGFFGLLAIYFGGLVYGLISLWW